MQLRLQSATSWAAAALAVCLAAPAAIPVARAASAAAGAPSIASPICRSFERTGIAGDAATDALADGTVWYADKNGNRLVRINPDRTRTPFVPTDGATGRLSGVAIGPDGNVWYTKDTANRVGRIPPDGGQGVEFETPEPLSLPSGLVAGRDGQLWFHSPVRNYIGRLGSDGAITVYRGPTAQSRGFSAQDMALGPDGNLWTTDIGHNAIYRFDVASSAFRRFDIATPNAQPGAITAGADGNLWFTMFAVRKVGRITPQGAITEYALGDLGGGAPKGIVGTPDGTIWITTSGRSAARILPNGSLQTFACGQGLGTALVGPAGAPWFLDGNRVWVVEDANAPLAPRPVASAPVAGTPWPVAGAPRAGGASPIRTMTLRDAIDALPATRGRVVLQFTSNDPNCTYCVPANPALDAIAARRAQDATYWRVTYEPWTAIRNDPDAASARLIGLPTIVVFQDGQEVERVEGTHPELEIEQRIFGRR